MFITGWNEDGKLPSYSIAGSPEDADHLILPLLVIRFPVLLDAALPYFRKERIVGTERPDILDSSCPPAGMVEDQETPASVIPAHFRAGQVHGAIRHLTAGLVPEKGAGMGEFFKDALVIKEFMLVGIDCDRRFFTGIIVADQEAVIPEIFLDNMHITEMAAAFPALETFESQSGFPLSGGSARWRVRIRARSGQ